MTDLRTRLAAIIDREVDGFWEPLDVADAVIRELGLREERWKSDDPKMLRGYWTRYVTDWIPPIDGAAAPACADGCMWQIPNHFEDMTAEQRELLQRLQDRSSRGRENTSD